MNRCFSIRNDVAATATRPVVSSIQSVAVRIVGMLIWGLQACLPLVGSAQTADLRSGEVVPRDVRDMYDLGLQFLAATQAPDGTWPSDHRGAGVTGLGVMCFLASGEDPNFGVYASNVRRGLQSIIRQQNQTTGYFPTSMYHHGFAMLALAEAYGMVDPRSLWTEPDEANSLSIGSSLELAVRAAITSQKSNPHGAWRYNPGGSDADTSVAGAVLIGLLAARNAGLEVPDEAIDRGIEYLAQMTAPSGQVAYSQSTGGHNDSVARVAIASLVFAVARRKDMKQFQAATNHLQQRESGGNPGHGGVEYQYYYQAQALFQADLAAYEKWNRMLIRNLKSEQASDGSFDGAQGRYVATTLSLLALAVNYRFLPIYER
jgi:hypothetical protein